MQRRLKIIVKPFLIQKKDKSPTWYVHKSQRKQMVYFKYYFLYLALNFKVYEWVQLEWKPQSLRLYYQPEETLQISQTWPICILWRVVTILGLT